ncbi:hypothetical protein P7K49_031844 [Saguinus oedipus]|uniref:Uncharacterized protein n=1 Tax=Saguinus oedipus TaxID=9490 RepID=A0ABQ9U0J8_SAGOE|nr:hypothetical protein P7K49_031844 [Saguinus oedipus]
MFPHKTFLQLYTGEGLDNMEFTKTKSNMNYLELPGVQIPTVPGCHSQGGGSSTAALWGLHTASMPLLTLLVQPEAFQLHLSHTNPQDTQVKVECQLRQQVTQVKELAEVLEKT